MSNKQISILGCGWLGLPLAQHFISKGYKVKGSTTSQEKESVLKNEHIEPYVFRLGDSNNEAIYKAFLTDSDIIVINFPPKRIANIEDLYETQLASIIPFISEDQKIVFVSSTSVYQNTNDWVFEDLKVVPEKASGKAVLKAENLLFQHFKHKVTVVRFSGLIGPNRFPGRFLAGKKDLPNAKAPVNVIHQTDCIGLISEIINQNYWGEILNGCADKHPTREDYYTKAALKIGLEPPTFSTKMSSGFKRVSNTKSKTELGFNYQLSNPMDMLD